MGRALLQYDWCLCQRRRLGHRQGQREGTGENGHLQAAQRNPHLGLGLSAPSSARNTFLSFEPPCLWREQTNSSLVAFPFWFHFKKQTRKTRSNVAYVPHTDLPCSDSSSLSAHEGKASRGHDPREPVELGSLGPGPLSPAAPQGSLLLTSFLHHCKGPLLTPGKKHFLPTGRPLPAQPHERGSPFLLLPPAVAVPSRDLSTGSPQPAWSLQC